ncbi:AAA family ATPase [uncultured Sphingomonas sp.]|uniref:AAA family ATPase n=1 Tax=uncultured Sphingomonas sp. TaxID=158754 RepID=UPI0025D10BD0|nr:AAA family ATPase [uncultured Sphingomonas sp.]
MTGLLLKELDIVDFRSIRGHVHAPLDAQVVLVHGENGAGKTSLLSAIELALTGGVQSLRRADPDYAEQLMHRSAASGSVTITTAGNAETRYSALLNARGIASSSPIDHLLASFFSERSYLPQALLGQLLQIYQDAGDDADSPLARFVGELLRLDRLDAIEAGLKPLVDVRNVRKITEGWSEREIEKTRLETLIKDQKRMRAGVIDEIAKAVGELRSALATLGIEMKAEEGQLDAADGVLRDDEDDRAFDLLTDRRRQLASIRREVGNASPGVTNAVQTSASEPGATEALAAWDAAHGTAYVRMRERVEALLTDVTLPADMRQFGETASTQLNLRVRQASARRDRAATDAERLVTARGELKVAEGRATEIAGQIERIPTKSGGLAAILSEITAYVDKEKCPVCDRDYREVENGSLVEHVHAKVRTLSASAQRLLELGRASAEAQALVEQLTREIAKLEHGVPDARALAELDRQVANLEAARIDLAGLLDPLREGARLRHAEIAARRAVSAAQSRSVSLAAARETLSQFAGVLGTEPVGEGEQPEDAAVRIETTLAVEATRLETRLAARRDGLQALARARTALDRRAEIDRTIAGHDEAIRGVKTALARAQSVRDQGIKVRNAVDAVRSSIIRREFNDRLNRLWRDLFVRLAPGEPFIPAFRIPDAETQRIQPRLVTEHRDGGAVGGTPGAMLSAGNLNTAALTLFLALHLSVPETLPWLILDDPVQSMDDVHIAHLAALLRTLSKEHGRQIIIAVHDRQLFEYLRLELSPAFPTDSLLTLELARGPHQDTRCLSRRFSFKEETSLLAA